MTDRLTALTGGGGKDDPRFGLSASGSRWDLHREGAAATGSATGERHAVSVNSGDGDVIPLDVRDLEGGGPDGSDTILDLSAARDRSDSGGSSAASLVAAAGLRRNAPRISLAGVDADVGLLSEQPMTPMSSHLHSKSSLNHSHGHFVGGGGFAPSKPEAFILSKLPSHWNCSVLFLLILGILTAGIGALLNIATDELMKAHESITAAIEIGVFSWLFWWVYYIVLLFAAIFITTRVPTAAGSGIPEMKSILSGVHLHQYLSFKTFLVKAVCLPLSVGSGAFLGKEGPFVHMSSMIARQMARLGIFSRIRENKGVMMQMLSAGVAVGVASNFGAPIGGVLFSIEVTSTYYPVRNYWSCYVAALPAALLFRYFWNLYFPSASGDPEPGFRALLRTNFDTEAVNYGVVEIFAFVILGLLCGLLGVGFIRLNSFYIKKWKWFRTEWLPSKGPKFARLDSPYFFAFVVATITAFFTYPGMIGDFMGMGSFRAARDLFSPCMLTSEYVEEESATGENTQCQDLSSDWGDERLPILLSLFLFTTVRYFLVPLSIMLQTPLGLYTPVMATGAGFGRFFGEIVDLAFNDEAESGWIGGGGLIAAGGYAVAGGAALCAGATHTLSSAVILFELTGQIHHLMPTLAAVVCAVAVSKKFSSLSIYDSIGRHRGLPFLSDLQQASYDLAARDVMDSSTRDACISSSFLVEDVVRVLSGRDTSRLGGHIPVVADRDSMTMVGMVSRDALSDASDAFFATHADTQAQLAASATRDDESGSDDDATEDLERSGRENQQQLPESLRPMIESAIQLYPNTALTDIHLLLTSMHLEEVFITQGSKLVGIVTRDLVQQAVREHDSVLTFLGD